jgi:hypothetical protein
MLQSRCNILLIIVTLITADLHIESLPSLTMQHFKKDLLELTQTYANFHFNLP